MAAPDEKKPHIFPANDSCPFEDCSHWNICTGAWHRDGPIFVPEFTIEHDKGVSGATFTGGQPGASAVVCRSWSEKQ